MTLIRETAKLLYKTRLCSLFRIQKHGFRLRYFPTSMSKRLWLDPFEKRDSYREVDDFFLACLRPGDVVVDAGANIGYYSLLSSTIVGGQGKVYAIEAHPRIYDYLSANIRLNRAASVKTFHTALGSNEGHIRFSDKRKDDLNQVTEEGNIIVPLKTLDSLPLSGEPIRLLKIDVEGYEKFVLEGAEKVLARTDIVFFEAWSEHFRKYDYRLEDILRFLNELGFGFLAYRNGGLHAIDETFEPDDCINLVAVRDTEAFKRETGTRLTSIHTDHQTA